MGNKAVHAVLTLFLLSGCTDNSEPSSADRSAVVAAQTQDGDWIIGGRTLPAPGGASDALREVIANAPQPDTAGHHIQASTLTTPEEWAPLISALNAGREQRVEALAERWSVTIKETEIAGVTVRTVTPA